MDGITLRPFRFLTHEEKMIMVVLWCVRNFNYGVHIIVFFFF